MYCRVARSTTLLRVRSMSAIGRRQLDQEQDCENLHALQSPWHLCYTSLLSQHQAQNHRKCLSAAQLFFPVVVCATMAPSSSEKQAGSASKQGRVTKRGKGKKSVESWKIYIYKVSLTLETCLPSYLHDGWMLLRRSHMANA